MLSKRTTGQSYKSANDLQVRFVARKQASPEGPSLTFASGAQVVAFPSLDEEMTVVGGCVTPPQALMDPDFVARSGE